jgi:hypothetical protein
MVKSIPYFLSWMHLWHENHVAGCDKILKCFLRSLVQRVPGDYPVAELEFADTDEVKVRQLLWAIVNLAG